MVWCLLCRLSGTLSHCHCRIVTVTLSACHSVTLSACHSVTLSACHSVTFLHCCCSCPSPCRLCNSSPTCQRYNSVHVYMCMPVLCGLAYTYVYIARLPFCRVCKMAVWLLEFMCCVCVYVLSSSWYHLLLSPLIASVEAFVMGKIHKEIAMFMLEASEDGERSEQSFVKVRDQLFYNLCVTRSFHDKLFLVANYTSRKSDQFTEGPSIRLKHLYLTPDISPSGFRLA